MIILDKIKTLFRRIFLKKKKPQRLEDCSKAEILDRIREVIKRLNTPLTDLPESFFRADFATYREFILEPFYFMDYTKYNKDHPIEVRYH